MTTRFLDHPAPLAIVHRGGAAEAHENSLDAFARAHALGFRWFETDVRVTADGVLVVFHDARLHRTVPGAHRRRRLADVTYAELQRLVAPASVPRFADLLGAFPDTLVNVDPKHDDALRPLAAVLQDPQTRARVNVGSFSTDRLRWLSAAFGASLSTGLGPDEVARLAAVSRGRAAARLRLRPGTRTVQVPPSVGPIRLVTPTFVAAAHDLGLAVHVWTVDDPHVMRRLLDLGVDGIMTDRPTVLREVLRERGQWVAPGA